ncbi:restriction endonuclease subunit S [Pasteurella testudinis]|uniref:restriction endonuclease subunit S n=1 Tax=Pasteurella testudinis TaxID=761 RepID=UPI004058D0C0
MNQLPNGWKQINLKNIIDGSIKNGFSPVAASHETGYWVLSLGALTDDGIQVSEIKPVLPESKILENILSMNDFLVSRSNTPSKVGRSIRFQNEINNCAYPDLMMRFRINSEKADVAYIEQFLRSSFVRSYFTNSAAGSSKTMVKINKRILENTLIYLPENINEQTKIAQILTTWDNAIRTIEQLIQNSEQQKQALMQQLLTGKKRLLDEHGERFGGVWQEYKLFNIAQITMGASPKSEFYNEAGNGLPLIQGNADIFERKSKPRIYTSSITKECFINDILISVRAPVGTVAISNHNACVGRGIAVIRAKKNHDQKFLYQWLLWFEPRWVGLSQGSTFESINSDDIKGLLFSIPPLLEQQKIAAVLTTADNEIDTLKQTLCRLKTEKQALMQQLLTGKRRVRIC